MKNLYIIALLLFSLSACDNVLEKYPQTSISPINFWKTESDLKMASNALYNGLNNGHTETMDLQSDDYYGRSTNDVSSGTLSTSNEDDVWKKAYTNIRKANDILENAGKAEVSEKVRDRYLAEAKFFRAFQYARLIKRFGDVPLVLTTLGINSPELEMSRTPRQEIIKTITDDLLWTAGKLPKKKELITVEAGRITRGAALAVLSQVALYEGTLAKYHKKGDSKALLEMAKQSAATVIAEQEFSLFPEFSGIFLEANEGNVETILRVFYKEIITNVGPRTRGLLLDANMTPTKYLADAFLCSDGLPVEYSDLFKGYSGIATEFQNRDSRMSATIWEPLTPFENKAPLIPELTRARTGYWPKKPGDITALEKTFVYTDYIIMRYAEVLLNFAEATYELTGSISDADLNLSINQLRKRAGMPSLTNAFVNGSNPKNVKLNMLDEIRRERRVELAGEGYRYDDLIRWKLAEKLLPRQILGCKFQQSYYQNTIPGKDVILDGNGFIITQKAESRSFADPKNYLFPIPLRELSLNSDLTQNTGWD